MGNEGSLPTDEDIEGFEYQARSPPSAIPPGVDPQAYVGANANDPRLQQPAKSNGMAQNVGGRLKGNPFKRGHNAHNQNSFGIEKAPGQTTLSSYPSPSEMQGDNLAYGMGQASVGVGGQPYPTHPQQYPQQQQQQIYAQQQYQQQQQQQYYHTPGEQPIQQQPIQQQPQPQQFPQLGRKTRPGQRAGAAILNGMRNLNISSNINSAMNRIGGTASGVASPGLIQKLQQQNQRRQQQQVQNVNEWETRWDEDSDEEDEDEEPDMQQQQQTTQQLQQPIAGADALPTTAISPPIGPPELDSGFSGAAAALVSPEPQAQQPQKEQPPAIFQQPQPHPGAAVAVTPGSPSKPEIPDDAVTDDEAENDTTEDDGVEWDTGQNTTPNVEQFMPLLRVLGKGSFGKVRMLMLLFFANCLNIFRILTQFYFFTTGCFGSKTRGSRKGVPVCNENTEKIAFGTAASDRTNKNREKGLVGGQPSIYYEVALCFPVTRQALSCFGLLSRRRIIFSLVAISTVSRARSPFLCGGTFAGSGTFAQAGDYLP